MEKKEELSRDELKQKKISKFECPDRLYEMGFEKTIDLLELSEDSNVLDIGSGTGVYIFKAAEKAKEAVSVEFGDLMLEIQRDKIARGEGRNVVVVDENIEGKRLNFSEGYFKGVLLITVLHEIMDRETLTEELYRVLENGGRAVVLDFKKEDGAEGPPIEERLSEEEVSAVFENKGFKLIDADKELGLFYRLVFEK